MTQSELMDLIFERPGLYIGNGSVIRMESFIDGFTCGIGSIDDVYRGFGQWMIEKRLTRGQYRWSSVTTLIGGSEQEAFKVAREFWNEYKKSLETGSELSV